LIFLVVVAGLYGLLIGSFLNVVVWRLPRGESLIRPASHCPNCGHPIRAYDNIPVLSWLILRGKCRDCGQPISARYPAIELGVGLFFAAIAFWAVSGGIPSASLPAFLIALAAYLYLGAISVALAIIDLETRRLPNVLVLPAYGVGAVLLTAAALLGGDAWSLVRAAIGAVALFVGYLLISLISRGGMGLGDVKLAGVLGLFLAWLGWGELAAGTFFPFLLGGLFSIVLLLARRAGRKSKIPFGPWMLMGAWVGIFWGEQVFGWYLRLFGLA